jgi:tRNA pseudouridine(55) synthase
LKNIFILNKKEGETPLQALEAFRAKHPRLKHLPMTYAGRLDPLASGIMILLAGEETKKKEKYLGLDKEYEFVVLFGFATDTYDVLGKIVKKSGEKLSKEELEKGIAKNLKYFKGKFKQDYPMYSSKTVKGKPLFEYARNGEDVEVPSRDVNVKRLKLVGLAKVSKVSLHKQIKNKIKKVKGDFRQEEISILWEKSLLNSSSIFFLASFQIKCSSGTYVRDISNSLGENMGIPALAFSIKRTRVGRFGK